MMASYSRKKIRRRKTKSGNGSGNAQVKSLDLFICILVIINPGIAFVFIACPLQNRSVTPSPNPSPRHSSTTRPSGEDKVGSGDQDRDLGGGDQQQQQHQRGPGCQLQLQQPEGQQRSSRGVTIQTTTTTTTTTHLQNPNTLHPLGVCVCWSSLPLSSLSLCLLLSPLVRAWNSNIIGDLLPRITTTIIILVFPVCRNRCLMAEQECWFKSNQYDIAGPPLEFVHFNQTPTDDKPNKQNIRICIFQIPKGLNYATSRLTRLHLHID